MKNNVKKITALTVNFLVLGSLTLINTSSYADENGGDFGYQVRMLAAQPCHQHQDLH